MKIYFQFINEKFVSVVSINMVPSTHGRQIKIGFIDWSFQKFLFDKNAVPHIVVANELLKISSQSEMEACVLI